MKYTTLIIILLLFALSACTDTHQSNKGESRIRYCEKQCNEKYGTSVDWVGSITGDCYCN